ncbi:DUF317 domain-containing protein [Streptomyces sp. GMY02]|nr:DUF317 domain-containing protein [Streptomyces sp. GMY02]
MTGGRGPYRLTAEGESFLAGVLDAPALPARGAPGPAGGLRPTPSARPRSPCSPPRPDRADVHVGSKDGCFYLGWFSNGRPGTDGEGWTIAVTGTAEMPGYRLSFDTETLADIVAAAVARVLETSRRV